MNFQPKIFFCCGRPYCTDPYSPYSPTDLARIVNNTVLEKIKLAQTQEIPILNNAFLEKIKLAKTPLELLHTHLGFLFPNVFPCLLVIISLLYFRGEYST
jgi:hypothetical protein